MNRRRSSPNSTHARSPFAGCTILIIALGVMICLIAFSIHVFIRQFNAIAEFTRERPQPVPITSLENQEPQLNQLAQRLENFRQELLGRQPTSLALSRDEINLAIAAFAPLRGFRGTLRIISIENDHLRLAIDFPLNGKPRFPRSGEAGWLTSDRRYLNGTLIARPLLANHEVILQIDAIEVPGAQIPPEFVAQMSPYRLSECYLNHPVLGPAMAQLDDVKIANGQLILARITEVPPPAAKPSNPRKFGLSKKRLVVYSAVALTAMFGLFAAWAWMRSRR